MLGAEINMEGIVSVTLNGDGGLNGSESKEIAVMPNMSESQENESLTSEIGEKRKREEEMPVKNNVEKEEEVKGDEKVVEKEENNVGVTAEIDTKVDDNGAEVSEDKKDDKKEDEKENGREETGNKNESDSIEIESKGVTTLSDNHKEELVKKPPAASPNVHSVSFNGSFTRQPILTDRYLSSAISLSVHLSVQLSVYILCLFVCLCLLV